MGSHVKEPLSPPARNVELATPEILPDVATAPHPTTNTGLSRPAGAGVLLDALPAIKDAAQKVGGYKHLAEIASELDRGNAGQ